MLNHRVIKFRDFDQEQSKIRHFDLDGYDKQEHDSYGNTTQFTGLKDRDGVDIYEGDILNYETTVNGNWARREFQSNTLIYVVYKDGCFINENNGKLLKDAIISIIDKNVYAKIVGNHYENLDLIQ